MKTGLLYDPIYLQHDTGAGHPECAERLSVTMRHLRAQHWFDQLALIEPNDVDDQWLLSVHDPEYLQRAVTTCQSGAPFLDSMDVSVCRESYGIARQATGGVLAMADQIMKGNLDNGFALVRPPGHHAEKSMALGFCLFNNVAVLARYLQKNHGLDKVMILDWDVHHGNGTQHTFEDDPSVLYISTHQYPYYPGSGAWYETGIGKGEGATLNCPMAAGSNDKNYETAFIEKIIPAIDAFKPEAIIISAGFDAHRSDPLGQINLSTGYFGWMTDLLLEKAERYSGGKVFSVLEGGYNLEKLPECIGLHIEKLAGVK